MGFRIEFSFRTIGTRINVRGYVLRVKRAKVAPAVVGIPYKCLHKLKYLKYKLYKRVYKKKNSTINLNYSCVVFIFNLF